MFDELAIIKNSRKKYLVIGDVMLDRYIYGKVKRISQEAPVPVLSYDTETDILGGAANVASNLISMGQDVSMASCVGADINGDTIISMLNEKKIDTSMLLRDDTRPSTTKIRLISNSQQMLRVDNECISDISIKLQTQLITLIKDVIDNFDIILLSDYNKGILNEKFTQDIIEISNRYKKRVVVDVKGQNAAKYRNAYLLKPNKQELFDLTGMNVSNKECIVAAMKKLKNISNCKNVITTLSGDGMILLDEDDKVFESNIETKQVYDVVGAGDTAFSYIALGLANNLNKENILKIANAAASIKVTKFGTSVVTIDEVIEKAYRVMDKIQSLEKLIHLLQDKRRKNKIVFTNGCFDIIHLGHIRYLKKAKMLGDILIVAINSDESVKRLKGEKRPINNEKDRLEMLAELNFIDYVILFSEDTPYNIIRAIKPDILVKGGDYSPEEVVGKDIVESYGGNVEIIDLVEGKSTTNILNKVVDSL